MGRGRMLKDSNGTAIQKAAILSTLDGTGTPQQSPIAVSSSEVEVVVPDYGAEVIIHTNQDIWIDNKTGVSSSQGGKLIADVYLKLSVEPGSSLFLVRDSADATVSLFWQNLEAPRTA